jgi:hypothetical protein
MHAARWPASVERMYKGMEMNNLKQMSGAFIYDHDFNL